MVCGKAKSCCSKCRGHKHKKKKIRRKVKKRCWRGYKAVKGKKPYSKGSCVKRRYKRRR